MRLGARELAVLDGTRVVAVHVRSLHKGTEDLVLDHYLEVLVRKPGALPGATALAQARAAGAFTALHQRYWDTARRGLGDGAGTRALIAVLLLHRTLPAAAVAAGITAALGCGRIDADLVAVEARRHLEGTQTTAVEVLDAVRPPGRPPGGTPGGTPGGEVRPAPSLAGYDELLAAGAR